MAQVLVCQLYYTFSNVERSGLSFRSGDVVTDFVVGKLLTVDCNERFTANDAANILSLYNNDCPMKWFSPWHELSPLELSRYIHLYYFITFS